jgi:hypothetical protein
MMRSVSVTSLGPEFHEFLYAPIGQDNDGMMLSVLSALARQDVDPWEEAARLARLPKETAVKQLIALLDAPPRQPLASPDAARIATRLIALLPRHTRLNLAAYKSLPVIASMKNPAVVPGLLFIVIYMTFILLTFAVITRF